MKIYFLFTILLSLGCTTLAQSTQTIRGTVTDRVTKAPLIGATIYVKGSNPVIGCITDQYGHYKLETVSLGRAQIIASYVGYADYQSDDFIVSSTKEVILNIEMEEGVNIAGVEIFALRDVSSPLNELAFVSSRSFSAEETERMPASINDVSKMALSFPGTQTASDDMQNDIIVRGNSPFGMTWHLEGIEIPSPNHFAKVGSSGGGVSILSAQLMSRSDFYTGGMPAEFGNSLSAAFDIRLKNGNLSHYENRAKLGLIGMDYAIEGPIKKERSSFILNYRYSTIGLMTRLGVEILGPRIVNEFTDLSFNLFFNQPEKRSHWNLFAIGGLSKEVMAPLYPAEEREVQNTRHWEDRLYGSNMGTTGIIYTKLINSSTYVKSVVAATSSRIYKEYDTLNLQDERFRYAESNYADNRLIASSVFSKQFDNKMRVKAGLIFNLIGFDFFHQNFSRGSSIDIHEQEFGSIKVNGKGLTQTLQAYTQFTMPVLPRLTISGGYHYLSLFLNGSMSLDPRFSAKFTINKNHLVSLAVGRYSKTLPLAMYNYVETDSLPGGGIIQTLPNHDLKMISSDHIILSYQYTTEKKFKLQVEPYFQHLTRVPVPVENNNDYSMLNTIYDFPAFPVNNEGRGYNYGIDLTIEKFFDHDLFLMMTGSLFDGKFQTNSGEWYHTTYASGWLSAITLGKEFDFGKGRVLQLGTRFIHNGGHRYSPYDPELSAQANTYVPQKGELNTKQIPAYWRIDGRVAYRFSRPKMAMNISFDLANISAHNNARSMAYNSWENVLYLNYHPGDDFIPLLNIQIDL